MYILLSELITRDISAGRLLRGDKLPPERIMAKEMNTTVRTLRKALDVLTDQGLIERRQGSGNYVRNQKNADSVYSFFRVELIEGGGLPTARVLSVDKMNKPDDLPEFGRSDAAHRIRRLRFLNEKPSVLEEIWLDGTYAEQLAIDDLSDSLYLFYKNKLKLWITSADDQIGLSKTPAWAPSEFELPVGQNCCYVERFSWSQSSDCAEFSRNWINNEHARYVCRIK